MASDCSGLIKQYFLTRKGGGGLYVLPYILEPFASNLVAYTQLLKAEAMYVVDNFELCQMIDHLFTWE